MKKTNCNGCGKEIEAVEENENTIVPRTLTGFCPDCLEAAIAWGFGRWIEAGCPGAKK